MNENHYLLLTPGPLTTTKSVKEVMLYDWCTWDDEYNTMVQEVRAKLVSLATKEEEKYTTVLMQGSGTFSVEAVIGSVIPEMGSSSFVQMVRTVSALCKWQRCYRLM